MIVNKVGIHRSWMSTVISAPLQHVDFPFFPTRPGYCDNLGPSRGRGFCFGRRRQSLEKMGGGGRVAMGVPSFPSPGIHIYKVCRLPREHLLLVTCAALIPTGCPDVPPPNLSLRNPQRQQHFLFLRVFD